MIKINFGVSLHSKYSPGVPYEERIVNIPDNCKLKFIKPYKKPKNPQPSRFRLKNYNNVRKDEFTELPAVSLKLRGDSWDKIELILVYLEQRNDWVAFIHHIWVETSFRPDEFELGPYQLDRFCKSMILKAYGMNFENLDLQIMDKDFKNLIRGEKELSP